jgi:hypothetical protein
VTRRIPDANQIVAEVKALATKQLLEKQASAPTPKASCTTGVAQTLLKLASILRDVDPNQVTYAEVQQFAGKMRTT